MLAQQIINILLTASIYLLVANSFSLVYSVGKFFNLAFAAFISLGAYLTYFLTIQVGLTKYLSIVFSIFIVTVIAICVEKFLFEKLKGKQSNSFVYLILSLGIYIILQNVISLSWGDGAITLNTGEVKVGHAIGNAYITDSQIFIIASSIVIMIGIMFLYNYSSIGRQIKAFSSNEELSKVFGINTSKTKLISTSIGSAIAAITGILFAFDTNVTPTFGFNLLLYGIITMIISGVGSFRSLILGAILLASTQHISAYYIDNKWMDAIAYVILILFLIWKPLGISGKQLKKVKI
jgi:branched-chain amino acid transport system permease protein